jgi:hypothetical protein
MSVSIKNKFAIKKSNEPVTFELLFDTLLLCVYDADLRLQGTNSSIQGFPVKGDNANEEPDKFSLPLPSSDNIGRRLIIDLTIINQKTKGGSYEIILLLKQGKNEKTFTTKKKTLSGASADEIFVVEFEKEGN